VPKKIPVLNFEECSAIARAAVELVSKDHPGSGISIAICGPTGLLLHLEHMDEASWQTLPIAKAKAFAAAMTRLSTEEFAKNQKEAGRSVKSFHSDYTDLPGGVPIFWREKAGGPLVCVGGFGVSGFSDPAIDVQVAGDAVAAAAVQLGIELYSSKE